MDEGGLIQSRFAWRAYLPWFIGCIFGIGAILKALSWQDFAVQISYYGMIRTAWVLRVSALGLIALEAGIAAALLLRWRLRSATLPITAVLLVGFSLALGWAWAFRDIKNCGCFGKYLPMGPAEAITKNLVLITVTTLAWHATTEKGRKHKDAIAAGRGSRTRGSAVVLVAALRSWRVASICGVAIATAGLALALSPWSPASSDVAEFSAYRVQDGTRQTGISKGRFLVALLSDSCEHCAETVAELNMLSRSPEAPPVVGLVLGEDAGLTQFRQLYAPDFPVGLVAPLDFFRLIGDQPPRFYLIEDGRALRFWDSEHVPGSATLAAGTNVHPQDAT